MNSDLENLRKRIDELDEELLKILGRRMEIVAEIGRYKKVNGLDIKDPKRMKELTEAQLARAEAFNLPEDLIKELYGLIYKYAIALETEA